jgi:hydroxyacylglutathione hydrolase
MKITDDVHIIASGSAGALYTHPLDCNVYAIRCGEEYVVIDSGVGVEPERIQSMMAGDGIAPERVRHLLLTHYHLDHSGGAAWMREHFRLSVSGSSETAQALETADEDAISLGAAKRAGLYPADFPFRACKVDRVLQGGEEWMIGDMKFQAIRTPGHSRDMISYLVSKADHTMLFCGDTIFQGGKILLQDTYDCDVQAYTRSLRMLSKRTIDALFPGHLLWVARDAGSHIRTAMSFVDRLLLPPNLL